MIKCNPVYLKDNHVVPGKRCIAVTPSGHKAILLESNKNNSWDVTLFNDVHYMDLGINIPTNLPVHTGNGRLFTVNEALHVHFVTDELLLFVAYSMRYWADTDDTIQRKVSMYIVNVKTVSVTTVKRVVLTSRLVIMAAARATKLTCLSRQRDKMYYISDDMDGHFSDPNIFVWYAYETDTTPSANDAVGAKCLGYVIMDHVQSQRIRWEARDISFFEINGHLTHYFSLTY